MWCRHCQQDVSASRGSSGPPSCTRCSHSLLPLRDTPTIKLAAIVDCGVELEEFDRATSCGTASASRPVIAASDDDLRRLERLLRPSVRSDLSHAGATLRAPAPPIASPPAPPSRLEAQRAYAPSRTSPSGSKALLVLGGLTFAVGVALLVAANLRMHEAAWRWGLATTIAGEGLLIGGLIALATRLWRQSRRVNSQLEMIDRRLGDVQTSVYPAGRLNSFSADYLWRFDAGEPLGRLDRFAVASR